jgi:hypothetical protein
MLTRFVLDPNAVPAVADSVASAPLWQQLEQHDRLLQMWQESGVLVLEGRSWEDSELFARLQNAPVAVRKRYQEALKQKVLRLDTAPDGRIPISAVHKPADLRVFLGVADLACVEETRAAVIGLQDDQVSCHFEDDGLEVTRLSSVDTCQSVRRCRDLRTKTVPRGTDTDSFWRERLAGLARYSSRVTVVDRYLGLNLVQHGSSGARSFLNRLDSGGGRLHVEMIVGFKDQDPTVVLQHLADFRLARGGITALHLFVVSDEHFTGRSPEFANGAHGRWIRFDHQVVQLDLGLEVLDGRKTRRDHQFSVVPWQHSLKLQAQQLKRLARTSQSVVAPRSVNG